MNNCERRTRHRGAALEAGDETFDELSFAGTEIASEREHRSRADIFGKSPAERLRLRGIT